MFGAAANASNVQVLVAGGAMPQNYLAANKVFNESRVDDAAQVWSAVVSRLVGAGLSPSLVELSNEPNGHWNTYIEPSVWARLACAAQAALVARGLGGVGISGPGELTAPSAIEPDLYNNDGLPLSALGTQPHFLHVDPNRHGHMSVGS